MPRSRDYSAIDTRPRRVFIDTKEWADGETRSFFLNGYEKVTRMKKDQSGEYEQYLYYLIPLEGKGIGEELTLGLFDNQAVMFQASNAVDYQEIEVTKVVTEKGENYKVVAKDNILPVADRPEELDYAPLKNPTPVVLPPKRKASADEEINIDDIPF